MCVIMSLSLEHAGLNTPSKNLSLDYLRSCRDYHYMSPTGKGKSYDPEILDDLINMKAQKKADHALTEWLKAKMAPRPDNGHDDMLEILSLDLNQTHERTSDMPGITLVESNTNTADVLRSGLLADKRESQDAKRVRAEIETAMSEMHAFRTELFLARSEIEQLRAELAQANRATESLRVMARTILTIAGDSSDELI